MELGAYGRPVGNQQLPDGVRLHHVDAPIGAGQARSKSRQARRIPCPPPPRCHRVVAQRAVGSGFSAVLYSDCRSVDDVKACVRQTKPDTPDIGGAYGAAGRRNCYMGLSGSAEYVDSLDQVVVAVMIEKRSLVDDLEEVLSISDIDMVQWGPTDYSMNIGRPGQTDAPEVVAAHDRVFRTALEMGVRPRAEIRTASEARRYLDMGVRHFAVGVDLNVLYDFWRGEGERIRSALEE